MTIRWGLVRSGECTTVVVGPTAPQAVPGAVWVQGGDSPIGPGWRYDGAFWSAPIVVSAPRHITRLAFLSRFTDAEAVAIDLASQGATPQAAAMRRYKDKVSAATFIDLDRQDTRAGVQALEAATLLQPGRGAAILDAPVQDGERYRG